jgi:hypothetical protein
MPKAKKNLSNMGLLVEVVDNDQGLLLLLQDSYLRECRKDLESRLNLEFGGIIGREKYHSKDTYSDFLRFFWCVISTSSLLKNLVSLSIGE